MTDNKALQDRFRELVASLDALYADAPEKLADRNVVAELRDWLDKDATPLDWAMPTGDVTADEWFFITTLYGQSTVDGQRTQIRKFFPELFIQLANRDIRNFTPDLGGFAGLRAGWMKTRLCKMGEILRERGITMQQYVNHLRKLQEGATHSKPTPALDAIINDHKATGWKTLSVFIRDCVGGNCFPIDSRVENLLRANDLPIDERQLVRLSLSIGRNPCEFARMFYNAGEKAARDAPGPRVEQRAYHRLESQRLGLGNLALGKGTETLWPFSTAL